MNAPQDIEAGLRRSDVAILVAFCALLFGIALVSGRPLSVHEGVLPESAREMLADGDWTIPKRAGAPWLENPPLPQWITVSIASVIGRCDELWIVRIGPALMGTIVALVAAWMGAFWFGRGIGLLSGLVMATTCQLARYAWLAEDEIFLAAVVAGAVALFVKVEFSGRQTESETPFLQSFFGKRSWGMLAFFVVLGMTNLVKGLLFGTVMALVPVAGFLLWNADWLRIRRYVWFWGWLAFATTALAWPVAAWLRHPGVLDLWHYDLFGRLSGNYTEINEPLWYYPVNLLWILAPWTIVLPLAFWITRRAALRERYSPERFLWAWALFVPVVFSIPGGKHHHYLLHALVPWAILASLALVRLREWTQSWPDWARSPLTGLGTIAAPTIFVLWLFGSRIPGPSSVLQAAMIAAPLIAVAFVWGIMHKNAQVAGTVLFGTLAVAYGFGHCYAGAYVDRHRQDAVFLKHVRKEVPANRRILVDMQNGAHWGDMCLFYLDTNADGLHNLSFLQDEDIRDESVYVISLLGKRDDLEKYGRVTVLRQSKKRGRHGDPLDPLTLFELRLRKDLERYPAERVAINPMQAIYREDGPYLGPQ